MWRLAGRQHGAVSRAQLLDLGLSPSELGRWVAADRLHRGLPGVYAVGRPQLTRKGQWMAAVLTLAPGAALSHGSAAALWGIDRERYRDAEVSVRARRTPKPRAGVRVHRRARLEERDVMRRDGIPATCPILTVIDVAAQATDERIERCVNAADNRDLVTPEQLHAGLDRYAGLPGWTGCARCSTATCSCSPTPIWRVASSRSCAA